MRELEQEVKETRVVWGVARANNQRVDLGNSVSAAGIGCVANNTVEMLDSSGITKIPGSGSFITAQSSYLIRVSARGLGGREKAGSRGLHS